MALEDLTGPAKFIDALVVGNPVSNDDRREGDDHIRGIKNVLRNTFPNLNGATTATDEDLNAIAAAVVLVGTALQKAANLSDLANQITARINLGLHDVDGHWAMGQPSAAGATLTLTGFLQDGSPVLRLLNGASALQAYLANFGSKAILGNGLGAAGSIGLVVNGFEAESIDEFGQVVQTQKPGATGNHILLKPSAPGGTGIIMTPAPTHGGIFLAMYQPNNAGKYMNFTADNNLTTPSFSINANGAGARLVLAAETEIFYASVTPPSLSGVALPDASNDRSIADTAYVHAHTVAGKGSAYQAQGSPALGTAYQNATNKGRFVSATVNMTAAGLCDLQLSPDNVTFTTITQLGGVVGQQSLTVLVPPAYWYRARIVSGVGTLTSIVFSV